MDINYKGQRTKVSKEIYDSNKTILTVFSDIVKNEELILGLGICIDFDNTKNITYATKVEDINNTSKRVKTKIGRYIRRVLKLSRDNVTDEQIVDIAGKIAITFIKPVFELVNGSDIAKVYCENFGNESCMSGKTQEQTENLLALYCINSTINLVKFIKGNFELRAIVWFTDEGNIIIDRMYTNNDNMIDCFKKEFPLYIASEQSPILFRGKTIFREHNELPRGRELAENYSVTLKIPIKYIFPYIDTFRYIKINKRNKTVILSNSRMEMDFLCNNTNGTKRRIESVYNTLDGVICSECNRTARKDRTTYINDKVVCNNCRRHNYKKCDVCKKYHKQYLLNTEWYPKKRYICNTCRTEMSRCDNCNTLITSTQIFLNERCTYCY